MADMSTIGKYEIRKELGRGAMGVVYEGYDPMIKRIVALKTIRADQLVGENAEAAIARFRREAQAAGRLQHPNIVSIYDIGEEGGHLVHRDGVHQGPRAQGLFRGERAVRAGGHRADHDADPRRARLLAQARRRPPRHQARERHPARRRRRQGRRLRHRAHRVVEHDAGRHGDGHAELHVARADHGIARRRALRPLLRRRHPVPVPDGRAPVQRLGDRHHAQGAGGRSAAAFALQRAGAGRDGRRRAEGAREAARRALPERRGVRRRVAHRRRAAYGARRRRHGRGAGDLRRRDARRAGRRDAHAADRACRRSERRRAERRPPQRSGARAKVADDGHRGRRRRGRHRALGGLLWSQFQPPEGRRRESRASPRRSCRRRRAQRRPRPPPRRRQRHRRRPIPAR